MLMRICAIAYGIAFENAQCDQRHMVQKEAIDILLELP